MNEIGPYHYTTGATLWAALRNAAGQVRNVTGAGAGTFEAWDDASIGDYDFAIIEQGTSGDYYADLPAGLSTSTDYTVTIASGAVTIANYRAALASVKVGPGNDGVFLGLNALNSASIAAGAFTATKFSPSWLEAVGIAAVREYVRVRLSAPEYINRRRCVGIEG